MDLNAAQALVDRFADEQGIRSPIVALSKRADSCFYDFIGNRIRVGKDTLNLDQSVVEVLLAYETALTADRRGLVRIFLPYVWMLSLVFILLVVGIVAWIGSSFPLSVTCFVMGALTGVYATRKMDTSIDAEVFVLEKQADAVAAKLCGAQHALAALEEYCENRPHIRNHKKRINYLRQLAAGA
ncbi:hypothetical protein LA345_40515 (plasmid) [Burkholderia vietnamiensis]|uniref:Uncharacterized protein n=1 Tax=Burkholderia vietnamiensis (strain G4 / LMG 22486) TaxID=269482 RepID=A4JU10_BURVG|nr:hypothetical protein Bcep1808_6876 [Burkholderia vietnamiensis G4]MCB4350079.1 hypothetical protein [Burkholderia vietnamiensis]